MELEQIKTRIRALAGTDRKYEYLDLAWRYLSAVPSDVELTPAVARGLVDIGLAGPARELLHAGRQSASHAVAHDALRSALAKAPIGRMSWAEFKEQYRTNLKILLEAQPYSGASAQVLDHALRAVHLYRTSAGHYQLSRRKAGHFREWMPGLCDYRVERNLALDDITEATLVVLDGLSLGPITDTLFERTANFDVARKCPLVILEQDWSRAAAWLHIADRRKLLSAEHVFLFGGPPALEDFESFLMSQESLTAAVSYIVTPPLLPSHSTQIREICARVEKHNGRRYLDCCRRLEQRYATRDLAYWRKRLQDHAGAVVGLTSRHTTMLRYSTRDIGHALENLGFEFHLIMEPNDHSKLTRLRVARLLEELDPVLIIMVDHLRYEYGGMLYNIPVLTWIQDPLSNLLCRQAGDSIGKLDFVCGYYRPRCVEEFGYPPERFWYCPVPASTRIFHERPVLPPVHEEYDCDIMYVGHMPESIEEYHQRWLSTIDPQIVPLLVRAREEIFAMLERGEHPMDGRPLIVRLLNALGLEATDETIEKIGQFYVLRIFDMAFRLQTLDWVDQWVTQRGYTFCLYGRGWNRHPNLRRYARGPIRHGNDLRCAYHCAKLVLQLIPSGFEHQRSFEALLSGSLVLARYSPLDRSSYWRLQQGLAAGDSHGGLTVPEGIFPMIDQITFNSAEQFRQLADRYLASQEDRTLLRRQFRDLVLQDYTYDVVTSKLISRIDELLAQPGGH